MDGTSEWTELGMEQGQDHLAMLSPVEAHYQSLLQGFSSVTTRLRHYSFHAFWVVHYKRNVRNDARRVFEDKTRRVEALYALAAAQHKGETGVAGARFAEAKLKEETDIIDFRVETDYETDEKDRYLAPLGGGVSRSLLRTDVRHWPDRTRRWSSLASSKSRRALPSPGGGL